MSRIASTSGVRVAAQPVSNIYTVLLLVALLALVFALVFTMYVLQTRYGGSAGYGDEVDQALQGAARAIEAGRANGDAMDDRLKNFPAGGGPPPAAPPPPAGAAADPFGGT